MNARLLPADERSPAYMSIEHTEDEAVYHDASKWQLIGTGIEQYIIKGEARRTTFITLVFRERSKQ